MRARGLIIFVLLNVVISIGVALAVLTLLDRPDASGSAAVATVPVVNIVITATPGPTQTPFIITATPRPGEISSLPDGVLDPTATPPVEGSAAGFATVDPLTLTADPSFVAQGSNTVTTALPEGCITHALEEGESPAYLAGVYGTDVNSILLANGLDEESATLLQIGQQMIIPLEGCPLEQFVAAAVITQTAVAAAITPTDGPTLSEEEAATEAATLGITLEPSISPTPTITPTITLAPTAVDAQVEIQEIFGAGDITSESVIIFNNGRRVNIGGWTLSDADDNVYVFPEAGLFNDSSIEILTRVGEDTPVVKYWGLAEAVWQPGDVATLRDAEGNVQSVYRIPAPVSLD